VPRRNPRSGCNPGWQLGERVNERCWRPCIAREGHFSPIEQIDFEDKGIRLCSDLPLRLRAARPFSLFLSGGTLLDAAPGSRPWGRWRCQPALAQLGKILWGEEIRRVITTDAVGAFAELPLPADACWSGIPPRIPARWSP
jgi:hypothetical protein